MLFCIKKSKNDLRCICCSVMHSQYPKYIWQCSNPNKSTSLSMVTVCFIWSPVTTISRKEWRSKLPNKTESNVSTTLKHDLVCQRLCQSHIGSIFIDVGSYLTLCSPPARPHMPVWMWDHLCLSYNLQEGLLAPNSQITRLNISHKLTSNIHSLRVCVCLCVWNQVSHSFTCTV